MTEPPSSLARRWPVLSLAGLMLCVAAYLGVGQVVLQQAAQESQSRVTFYTTTLRDALNRLDHLPFVVARDAQVVAALAGATPEALNPLLAAYSERAEAEAIYVMDINGQTLAASNYASAQSFVGQFYTFRPYFRDALKGQTGRFFAIGATTGRPGYFVGEPVRNAAGTILGVVVVKTPLSPVVAAWQDTGETLLVTSAEGVVLLSTTPGHLYRTLGPISPATRAVIEDRQQFRGQALAPLDWAPSRADQVALEGADYVYAADQIAREGWAVHLITPLAAIQQRAAFIVAAGAAVLLAMLIAAALLRSAQLRRALALSNADRARLSQEIEVRRAAEAALRDTQAQLERSSRLAALGQLAASITHELGQPISAMRNYLAAEEIAQGAAVGGVNAQLSGLVERMQKITTQLRAFATPKGIERTTFDLREATRSAWELVRYDGEGLSIEMQLGAEPILVVGDQARLEQVLVNVLRNALDATRAAEGRWLGIYASAERTGSAMGQLEVHDSGAGLEGRKLDDICEPFMTTKSSGKGMGLGLAISAQILKDLQGVLEARERAPTGAIFAVSVPLAPTDQRKTDDG